MSKEMWEEGHRWKRREEDAIEGDEEGDNGSSSVAEENDIEWITSGYRQKMMTQTGKRSDGIISASYFGNEEDAQ